ncbi:MAG: AMIN domain-containing protein, partial [Deltaproteobacteria bacterium]|nr:AMIN domain-containing protein [Deltaproteobacteria bacterium]
MRMAVLAMLALGTARTAQAADAAQVQANQAARITAVETSPDGRLAIRGTAKPSFTVFKMTEPSRLVIDLTGSDVTKLASPLAVKLDGVRGVTAAQFDEGSRRVARLVVGLDGDVKYDVTASGNDLFVAIKPQ